MPTAGKETPARVDPEVKSKSERRRFSAEYKRRIPEEADACTEVGQIGGHAAPPVMLFQRKNAGWKLLVQDTVGISTGFIGSRNS